MLLDQLGPVALPLNIDSLSDNPVTGQNNNAACDPATHNLPYTFHPMYSTSSEKTNVPWAVHTYNIAFADEIGHFDFCNGPVGITPTGNCPTKDLEGQGPNTEPSDADDTSCFPASSSPRMQVSGCSGENDGFDGQSYEPRWPDGNTKLHPTSLLFSSPLTGQRYTLNYSRSAFEADLPVLEFAISGTCDIFSGIGCSLYSNATRNARTSFASAFQGFKVTQAGTPDNFKHHLR